MDYHKYKWSIGVAIPVAQKVFWLVRRNMADTSLVCLRCLHCNCSFNQRYKLY
jgi:hypothetical protein